uniref:hypothetical protein n=1 Tax=Stylonema alsidii TaxID=35155 RepID=UPI001FCDA128|nr:hypothetical protein MW559_pgp148 [Stylonema alsidii]UNJ15144.1 hypothetical protein [Stylonema alsidii]
MDFELNFETPYFQKECYFLINISQDTNLIIVQYMHINRCQKFQGYSAKQLCNNILMKINSDLNNYHTAYLSRELAKAEMCLIFNQVYIQS